MSIWAHATKQNPCPVCGAGDWCTFGEKAMLCQRIVSEHIHPKGGYYHFYDELSGNKPTFIPKSKAAPKAIDAPAVLGKMRAYSAASGGATDIKMLANRLGVSQWSLQSLGTTWSHEHKAWAFPMRDGDGNEIGIRLRNDAGDKWAVTGSRQGIFLPEMTDSFEDDFVLLPEGPTSTAAFLTLGFFAIGRPNVRTGGEQIRQALKQMGIYKVVIVADNDKLKRLGQRFGFPGSDGAMALKKELGLPSVIWQPTGDLKDGRDFLKAGGTKKIIMAQIKDRIWTRS